MQKNHVPYGSDVSAGTYECVDCGHLYSNQAKKSMPPCPQYKPATHTLNGWKILTGQGDAVKDPYPNKADKPTESKDATQSGDASTASKK